MDLKNLLGFLSLGVISLIIAILVIIVLKKALKNLLDNTVNNTGVTTFYLKTFIITILFITLSTFLDNRFELAKESKFMEYVWEFADGLSSSFQGMVIILMVFLVNITILVSVLKRKK